MHTTNRHTEAESLYRRALEINEAAYGPDHPRVVVVLNRLGGLQYKLGDLKGARELIERARTIFWESIGEQHPLTQSNKTLIEHFDSVDEQLSALLQALTQATDTFGVDSLQICSALTELADLYKNLRWFEKAEPLYSEALAIREKQLGPDHPDTATSLNNLAGLLESKGDYEGAEPLYRRALEIDEKALGMEHPDTVQVCYNFAQMLRDKGDHRKSAELYEQAITSCEKIAEKSDLTENLLTIMAVAHNNLAFHSNVPNKNWIEAERHYKESMKLFKQLGNPIETANVELNLQTMFHLSGQKVDIDNRVKEITKILEEANDPRAEKGHKLLKEIS